MRNPIRAPLREWDISYLETFLADFGDETDDGPDKPAAIKAGKIGPLISPTPRNRPIPAPYRHIDVNFCKTPGCANFGVYPVRGLILTGRKVLDTYKIEGGGQKRKNSANLLCSVCKRATRIKSNMAIHEEYERQRSHMLVETPLSCPGLTCENHKPDAKEARALFRKYGKTHSGSDRWQCLACKKTFSLGKSTKGHKKPHTNIKAFELIVNKVSISRMTEILGLSYSSVYGKIDFLHEQCRLFSASREANFPNLDIPRLYLSTDRQDYIVNWGDRKSRRTIQMTAIGTADQGSGYVFGLVPNFDPKVNIKEVEADSLLCGDALAPFPLRKYARIWTQADYGRSLATAAVSGDDEDVTTRDDLDAPELVLGSQQLPSYGAQVHADYLMHGHYWHMRSLFVNVGKLRFFLDQDGGLLSACMGAFMERIRDRSADVIQVAITKDLTIDKRREKQGKAKAWFSKERKKFPDFEDGYARSAILTEQVALLRSSSPLERNKLEGVWIDHPFPDSAEPEKRWKFLTDLDDYGDEHVANLLLKATLYPIDVVFNRIRRRMAAFERPVVSVRRARRLWQIYAPYDPAMLEKYLTIFRVWHNYVWVSPKTGKTAAEVLGLAKGKIRIQDIIYFDIRNYIDK